MGTATIAFDFPRSKRIGSHLRMNSGTITMSSDYVAGGDTANFAPYFLSVKQVAFSESDTGYLFEYDYTNVKVKAYYPRAAHTLAVISAGSINASNAVVVANSRLEHVQANASLTHGANAAGGQVADNTDLSAVVVHFVVYGTC